jgi:uncharacterized cupin superfamily protein
VVPEAPLEQAGHGKAPADAGWFVLNAREARWLDGHYGAYTRFEGPEARFAELGFNIGVLEPGRPACMYHREGAQEDFLVIAGECLLLVEGEERRLRAWDFVHCPPWTEHLFVGAGDGPCTILAVGRRPDDGVVYPVSELAARYGGSVAKETAEPEEAYAEIAPDRDARFQEGWLPG